MFIWYFFWNIWTFFPHAEFHGSNTHLQWIYNRDLYVHTREAGTYVFTQGEKRHSMSLKQDFQWGSFRYKVFQQSCLQPLLQCAQYRLELDINYWSFWHMQHIISSKNLIPVLSISFLSLLNLIFFTRPFLSLLFPLFCPLFSNCSVMTLIFTRFLGLKTKFV